jgi:hypothetical protein
VTSHGESVYKGAQRDVNATYLLSLSNQLASSVCTLAGNIAHV